MNRYSTSFALVCTVLLLTFVGCGASSEATQPPASSGNGPTPLPVLHVTPTFSPSGGGGPTAVPAPVQVQTGAVTITLAKTQFAIDEPIAVEVANGLTTQITTSDHQSGCTIVTLQSQDANGLWQVIAPCRQGTPTRLIPIAAGSSMTQTLGPPSTGSSASWSKGTYRLMLGYTFQVDTASATVQPSSAPSPVYSTQFTIG